MLRRICTINRLKSMIIVDNELDISVMYYPNYGVPHQQEERQQTLLLRRRERPRRRQAAHRSADVFGNSRPVGRSLEGAYRSGSLSATTREFGLPGALWLAAQHSGVSGVLKAMWPELRSGPS